MRDGIRRRLTYANVMATIAVFVALGGSSYAALSITGRDVKDRSLTGKDIRRNSLTGRQIKEGRLGLVPRARQADRLGGVAAPELLQRCPAGTVSISGACVEIAVRAPAQYSLALDICQREAFKDLDDGAGRLPTWGELYRTVNRAGGPVLSDSGELTEDVADVRADGVVVAVVLTSRTGRSAVVPDSTMEGGARPYRCAMDPRNAQVTDP